MSSPVFLLSSGSIYPVLKFTIEGKLVFWLPVWHFVHPEPVECGLQVSRLQSADVLHICEWQKTLRFSLMLITNTQATALRPLKSSASGSSTFMTITFQSVSPSSIRARVPNTFTRMTSPGEQTWCTHDRTLKLQELWRQAWLLKKDDSEWFKWIVNRFDWIIKNNWLKQMICSQFIIYIESNFYSTKKKKKNLAGEINNYSKLYVCVYIYIHINNTHTHTII